MMSFSNLSCLVYPHEPPQKGEGMCTEKCNFISNSEHHIR